MRTVLWKTVIFIVYVVDVMMDKGGLMGYTSENAGTHTSDYDPSINLTKLRYLARTTGGTSRVSQEYHSNNSIKWNTNVSEILFYCDTVKDWSYIEQYEDPLSVDELLIDRFKGELHRYVIAKQLKYCPYKPLCIYSFNATISHRDYKPCCEMCSCLSNCSYHNDCCPDIIPDVPSDSKDRVVPSCIPLHLNMKFKNPGNSYNTLAISQCKTDTSYAYGTKCTQDYKTSIMMRDILPVLHNKSGNLYRNIHCALCNGVRQTELEFFKPNFSCIQYLPMRFQSEADFIQKIRASWMCDVRFEHDSPKPVDCHLSSSACDETGVWENYNADYVRACASYSPLFESDHVMFRNIFCAMCNRHPIHCTTALHPALPYSFSELLNFDTGDDYQSNSDCIQGYLYHAEEDVCIPVTCNPTRILKKTTCLKIMDKVTVFKYSASLRLTPSKRYSLEHAYTIADHVFIGLRRYMESYLANNSSFFHICVADTLLMVNRYCAQEMEIYMRDSEFLFYLFKLEFIIRNEHDPENILSKLINASFDVRYVTEDTINETIIVNVINTYKENFEHGERLIFTGDLDEGKWRGFCSFDNKTLIPKHPYPPELEDISQCYERGWEATPITSFLACPAVQIKQSTYPWVLNKNGVYFPDKHKYFTHDEFFVLTQNQTSQLFVCSQQFFALTTTTYNAKWTVTVELVVSSTCVALSAVCLFLTFLVYCLLKPLQTLPGKNTMSLVGSLLFAQLLYLIGSFSRFEEGSVVCKVIGILTHYAWLLVAFWMNVCTFHMCRVLTKINATGHMSSNKRFVIYHIYCGVSSACFIVINVVSSLGNSDASEIGYGLVTCYISSKEMIIYTMAIPLAVIIVVNIVMFIVVIITIKRSSGVQKNVKNERNDIAIFVRLSTLTGTTWVFGFVYIWSQWRVFSYLFTVLNAGQGVFIFMSFVCKIRVLKMLKQRLAS